MKIQFEYLVLKQSGAGIGREVLRMFLFINCKRVGGTWSLELVFTVQAFTFFALRVDTLAAAVSAVPS